MRAIRSLVGAILVVAGAWSCGGLGPDSIAGTYDATTFTYAKTGTAPVNVLTAGGSIHLQIFNDLSTGGSINIPASVTGTNAFVAGLLGSTGKEGDVVLINTAADTFLAHASWAFDGKTLQTTSTQSSVTYVVTLTRQ